MRYIGNKENIIPHIYSVLESKGVVGRSFFDFFSGTASVAKFYKRNGYKIYASDMMYFSYCLQKAYIGNNEMPMFKGLRSVIGNIPSRLFDSTFNAVLEYLDTIPLQEGFIFENYTPGGTSHLEIPRMYFIDDNGKRIDAIRQQIEHWNQVGLLTENEYYILISCLIETVSFYANVSGVYAAFQKKWDPRAIKEMRLRPVEIIINDCKNEVYQGDSLSLLDDIDADILYLDPPYNERQYAPNYHLLETIACYDAPVIRGLTGMREYSTQKSSFCNVKTALADLDRIARTGHYKYLVLSYNSEGIMDRESIMDTLSQYGKVELEQFEYLRFKSNNNGASRTKRHVYEQVYILKRS